jgi:hypothetical protein
MSGNNIANGTIINNSNYDMWLVSSNIASGHWNTAPITVPRQSTTTAFVAQGTQGTATGTSGSMTYSFNGTTATVVLGFDDAYSSSNSAYSQDSAGSLFKTSANVPKSGSNVVFTYVVTGP